LSKANNSNLILVDSETGENYMDIPEGSDIYTPEQKQAMKKKQYMLLNRGRVKFTNTNIDMIDYVDKKLTNYQIGLLMMLQSYVDYDGRLIKSQKDKRPLTRTEMLKILKLKQKSSTFDDFRETCVQANIMKYDKENSTHYINRNIIFKGKFKMMKVVSAVAKELKKISSNLKPTDIAILFKLQKHVHYRSMALVEDPDEVNEDNLKTLNAKRLSECLGVSVDYVYRRLPKLIYDGEYVIAKVQAGKKRSYMLNPKVFFRGDYQKVQDDITHSNSIFFKST